MPATVNDRQYVYRKTTTTMSKSNDPKSSRGRSTSSSSSTTAGRDGKKKNDTTSSNSEQQQRRTLSAAADDDDNEQGEFIGAQHGLLDPSRKLGRRQYAKPYDSGGGIGGSSQSQRIRRRRRRRRNHTNWFRSLWLGIGLFLVLYTFWILDTLKDPIFGKLVDGNLDKHQPIAKLISVGMTLVLVVLLEYISNERRRYAILQKQHKQQDIMMMNNNNYAMSMSGRGGGGVGGVGDGGNKNKNEDPMMAMMLDGGGTWSKMGFKNGGLHYDQYHLSNSERSSLSHRLGLSSSIGRTSSSSTDSTDYYNYNNTNNNNNAASITNDGVPDSIFTSIGIPYCVVFGIIAYMLQFHRNVAKAHGSSSSADDDDHDHDVHHEGENNNDNIAMLYEGHGSNSSSKRMKQMWYILGYFFYAAVESYGSLSVATFWSYVNSTLHLYDAEECYGTIIAIAQLGAIAGSTMITMHIWNSITLIVIACLIILLHIIIMTMFHKKYGVGGNRRHRHHHHRGGGGDYGGQYNDDDDDEETQDDDNDDDDIDDDVTAMTKLEQEPTLWSGVYLILKHNYVLLILGVSCLYEVSLTCLNYQMTILGHARFEEGSTTTTSSSSSSLSSSSSSNNTTTTTTTTTVVDNMSFEQFMGHYGQMVNFCSLLLSWFIFPFLIKVIGLRITVRIFPTLLLLVNIIAYGIKPGNLFVLFISVSILKAMTYSVHDPAKEILYMPTSKAIKYKSKAWIDVVGARIAKAIGSSINTMAGNVTRSIHIASIPSLITAIALWIICYYVGIEFDNLIQTKTIVGSSSRNNNNTDDDDDDIRNSVDFSTIVVFEGGGNDDGHNNQNNKNNNETNNNNKGDGNDDDEIDDSHFRVVHDDDDDDEEDKK